MWVSKTCSNQCLPAVNKGLKALNTCCYNERTCCLVPPRARLGNQKETRQQCCLLRARRLSWKLIQSGNWIFMFENIHKPGGMYKVWGTGRRILENISTMIFNTQNLSPDRKMQALGSTTILLPIVLEISLWHQNHWYLSKYLTNDTT